MSKDFHDPVPPEPKVTRIGSSTTHSYYQVEMAVGSLPSCVQTLSWATVESSSGQSWQKWGWKRGWRWGGYVSEWERPEDGSEELTL